MYFPKYVKCLVKVRNPRLIFMVAVSLHLVYYLSMRICLCLSLYFFCKFRVGLVGSVDGEV